MVLDYHKERTQCTIERVFHDLQYGFIPEYATTVTARRGADHLVASFQIKKAANAAWGLCGARTTPHDGQEGAIRCPHSSFPSSALPLLSQPHHSTF